MFDSHNIPHFLSHTEMFELFLKDFDRATMVNAWAPAFFCKGGTSPKMFSMRRRKAPHMEKKAPYTEKRPTIRRKNAPPPHKYIFLISKGGRPCTCLLLPSLWAPTFATECNISNIYGVNGTK